MTFSYTLYFFFTAFVVNCMNIHLKKFFSTFLVNWVWYIAFTFFQLPNYLNSMEVCINKLNIAHKTNLLKQEETRKKRIIIWGMLSVVCIVLVLYLTFLIYVSFYLGIKLLIRSPSVNLSSLNEIKVNKYAQRIRDMEIPTFSKFYGPGIFWKLYP